MTDRPLPPAYGPTSVSNIEGQPLRAVVHVAVAMSRDELWAVLASDGAEFAPDRAPTDLTVPQVRRHVEEWLAASNGAELDDVTRQMRAQAADWTPEQAARMDALAAAVDRAYPPQPNAEQQPTARRIVHVDTLDHDLVTVRCPDWCTGEMHQDGGYRADLAHSSDDTEFTVDTSRGPVPVLSMGLVQYPFTDSADTTDVTIAVGLAGDHFRYDPAGLDRLAARLVEIAGEVRAQARKLAGLQAEEEQR